MYRMESTNETLKLSAERRVNNADDDDDEEEGDESNEGHLSFRSVIKGIKSTFTLSMSIAKKNTKCSNPL